MGYNTLIKFYLVAYNLGQAFGWFLVLQRVLVDAARHQSVDGSFNAAGHLVRWMQLISFMDVVHSVIGIVPSGVLPSILQWGGRYFWIAAIVCKIKEVQRLPSVFLAFLAWSIVEVIRYPQYALNTIHLCPRWLTWLRYTIFIPLYPIGALCGEALLIYQALPYIKSRSLYENLFQVLPFNYYSFVVAVLAVYPVLWLFLYVYMFKQRTNKLQRRTKGKVKSKRSD